MAERGFFGGSRKEETPETTPNTETVNVAPPTVKEEPAFPTVVFLPKKNISVKPVIRENSWMSLMNKSVRRAFMYNSAKRTFTLPVSLKNNMLSPVLDEVKLVIAPPFTEPMTERQYFERMLSRDLGIMTKGEDNFWRHDPLARVELTPEGLELDLSQPIDMIRYKILAANSEDIATSSADQYRKPTIQFFMEDAELEVSKELENAERESHAWELYNAMKGNEKKLRGFLKVANRGVNANATIGWLQKEVFKVLKSDIHTFLEICDDKLFDDKVFILDAVRVGAVRKLAQDSYALDDGTRLGTIYDAIHFFNKDENSSLYLLVKERIDRVNQG